MGACLGDMGVENFKYQKSRLLDNQLNAWSMSVHSQLLRSIHSNFSRCGKSAEQSGSCLKGVGDMAMSEVGQMYFWQMDADLVQSRKLCKEFKCNLKGARDSSCSSFACGACGMDGRCTSV
jgi:hypothetical protein